MIKFVFDPDNFTAPWPRCIVTLGDFDGLHLGHRHLLNLALAKGQETGLPVVLLTYEPSPKKILQRLDKNDNIFTLDEKKLILEKLPLTTIFYPFDLKTARMSARRFLREIILTRLRGAIIFLGHDHCFGFRRRGNYGYLQKASQRLNFQVNQIEPFLWQQKAVSSSWIRTLLKEGDVEQANLLLGFKYFISGKVNYGSQIASKLGFPTANIQVSSEKLLPKFGVYAGHATVDRQTFLAAINIGIKPTFTSQGASIDQPIVEAHLLGFDGEIYGKKIKIEIAKRIRDEQKFDSVEDLKLQIRQDIIQIYNTVK